MKNISLKTTVLAILISIGAVSCGSDKGGSNFTARVINTDVKTNDNTDVKTNDNTDVKTNDNTDVKTNDNNVIYAVGDVRLYRDGEGLLVDARHKIVNAQKSDQSVYKQVYETLAKQTGNNAYHQSYTAYGLHNMGTNSAPDYRVVFAAKDIQKVLPASLDASYKGKAIISDPDQANHFLNGTTNINVKDKVVTGSFDFANNGKLEITQGSIITDDVTKIGTFGTYFNLDASLAGTIKGYTTEDAFVYGSITGKEQQEVVGAIAAEITKDNKTVEIQGVFAGKKQ